MIFADSDRRGERLGSFLCGLALAAILLAPRPSAATDGVLEINQGRAQLGSTTASDDPGFPVTLDAPGSYRLTSDLVVGSTETNAIEIVAPAGVTLDLNGFEIRGPTLCTGQPLSCSPLGNGAGITGDSSLNVVRNGTVRGFRSGIDLAGGHNTIEHVHVRDCSSSGINIGSGIVRGGVVASNAVTGIFVSDFGAVESSTVVGNGNFGVYADGPGCRVSNTRVSDNGIGMVVLANGIVAGVSAHDNDNIGIFAGDWSIVRGSNASSNLVGGIASGRGLIYDSVANSNGFGIAANDDGTIVRGCTASDNPNGGISMNSTGLLAGNSSTANDSGFFLGAATGYVNNLISGNTTNTRVGTGVQLGTNLCDGALCP